MKLESQAHTSNNKCNTLPAVKLDIWRDIIGSPISIKMNATARTHDISLSSYHIEDLATFGKSLSDAAVRAFPKSRTSSRYKEVHALLLSWEEDNLGVIEEIIELESVLKQGYKFETEPWRIPSTRSHNSLAKRLTDFLDKYERRDSLLIVYYGGHGYMNDSRQCVWSW